jgi:hypothetical protein
MLGAGRLLTEEPGFYTGSGIPAGLSILRVFFYVRGNHV